MRILVLTLLLAVACDPKEEPASVEVQAVSSLEDVTVERVNAVAPTERVLIDVRTPSEFATGRAPGAVNIPLSNLEEQLAQVPAGSTPYVICQSGGRSARATALLATHGIAAHNVTGGMSAWASAGLPTE